MPVDFLDELAWRALASLEFILTTISHVDEMHVESHSNRHSDQLKGDKQVELT